MFATGTNNQQAEQGVKAGLAHDATSRPTMEVGYVRASLRLVLCPSTRLPLEFSGDSELTRKVGSEMPPTSWPK